MYAGLHALLRCKIDIELKRDKAAGDADGNGILSGGVSGNSGRRGSGGMLGGKGFMGGGGGVDEAYLKAIDAQNSGGAAARGRGGGAPDVMTLDDRD